MPILRSPNSAIAMKIELEDDPGGPWLFGRTCLWIHGHKVGDDSLVTSLRDLYLQTAWQAWDAGGRRNDRLYLLPAEALFVRLWTALFGNPGPEEAELAEAEQWARFLVSPGIDAYDDSMVFLVEGEEDARFVFRAERDAELVDTRCALGEFDAVFGAVRRQLERWLGEAEHAIHSDPSLK